MKTFIFACVHNAGRSQMSAAFFNQLADPQKATAVSAGTQPAAAVHPVVIETMRELGIDLSSAVPQKLTTILAAGADMIVTMGCGDECPYVPGLRREDWPLPDPKGQSLDIAREVRDEVRRRVQLLIDAEMVGPLIVIRPAEESDRGVANALLQTLSLVQLNLLSQFGLQYAVASCGVHLYGLAGLEVYGEVALLRSVAVEPAEQGRGLGGKLAQDRISWAKKHGVRTLYLLTTTAAKYWVRFGFERFDRRSAPEAIQQSQEWSSACPASATAMYLQLL